MKLYPSVACTLNPKQAHQLNKQLETKVNLITLFLIIPIKTFQSGECSWSNHYTGILCLTQTENTLCNRL